MNKQYRDNLIVIGYSRHPVEKALLLTGNVSIAAAIDWMEENKNFLDYQSQLFIPFPNNASSTRTGNWSSVEATKLAKTAQL